MKLLNEKYVKRMFGKEKQVPLTVAGICEKRNSMWNNNSARL